MQQQLRFDDGKPGMKAGYLYLSSAEAQMSLGFGDAAPTERLFFAALPDDAAAAKIHEMAQSLRHAHGLSGKPLLQERLHVTLHHLGDYAGLPPSLLTRARAAAQRLSLPTFDVHFDRAGSFGGHRRQRPFVLRGEGGVSGMRLLQGELGRCMAAEGMSGDRQFTPHVTLLYDDDSVAVQPVESVGWQVREFVLIRSFLGQTRYQEEGRWSLR